MQSKYFRFFQLNYFLITSHFHFQALIQFKTTFFYSKEKFYFAATHFIQVCSKSHCGWWCCGQKGSPVAVSLPVALTKETVAVSCQQALLIHLFCFYYYSLNLSTIVSHIRLSCNVMSSFKLKYSWCYSSISDQIFFPNISTFWQDSVYITDV